MPTSPNTLDYFLDGGDPLRRLSGKVSPGLCDFFTDAGEPLAVVAFSSTPHSYVSGSNISLGESLTPKGRILYGSSVNVGYDLNINTINQFLSQGDAVLACGPSVTIHDKMIMHGGGVINLSETVNVTSLPSIITAVNLLDYFTNSGEPFRYLTGKVSPASLDFSFNGEPYKSIDRGKLSNSYVSGANIQLGDVLHCSNTMKYRGGSIIRPTLTLLHNSAGHTYISSALMNMGVTTGITGKIRFAGKTNISPQLNLTNISNGHIYLSNANFNMGMNILASSRNKYVGKSNMVPGVLVRADGFITPLNVDVYNLHNYITDNYTLVTFLV